MLQTQKSLQPLQFITILTIFSILISSSTSTHIISHENYNTDEIQIRAQDFNRWFQEISPESRVELGHPHGILDVRASRDINNDDQIMKVNKEYELSSAQIFETKYKSVIEEHEKQKGREVYMYLALVLLNEMEKGNDSKLKPWLDVLPRRPKAFSWDYWNKNKRFEQEFENSNAMRNIVEHRFLMNNKVTYVHTEIIQKHPNVFSDFFNQDNIEWAFYIAETKGIYGPEGIILNPILSMINRGFGKDTSKITKYGRNEDNTFTEMFSIGDYQHGDEVVLAVEINGERLLQYHGQVVDNNPNDCYGMNLAFTINKDDSLASKRKEFFSRFFLYDSPHMDLVEECLTVKNPFPAKLMFYYYTLMMEEPDLTRMDPKRTNLENDKIILEFVKNNLQNHYDAIYSTLEKDQERLDNEANSEMKTMMKFKVQQRKMFLQILELYNDEMNKLFKDDSL